MSPIASTPRHRIVTAGIGDAALIANIHASCFEEIWDTKAIREMLSTPGACGLLAYSGDDSDLGDSPAGLALARIAADEAELLSLGVNPAFRRHGIGSALLHGISAMVLAGGGTRMFLEVAVDNEPAVRLYCTFGFAECGFRRGYYAKRPGTIDARTALVMHCNLMPTDGRNEANGGIDTTSR